MRTTPSRLFPTAVFDPIYTVSFDSDGGTPVESQLVIRGETASNPGEPTRSLYTFKGWYLDGTLYIADENWDGAHISTDTLLNVAQAMRTPLTDVFSVSTSLFSVLAPWRGSTRAFISCCG